jgi:hypothetical protein
MWVVSDASPQHELESSATFKTQKREGIAHISSKAKDSRIAV